MAELVSLKMTGIRSIGDEPHVIKFLNPLTIIQGLNGTGKTTTIEALNYITTGSQPSGGMKAFIHSNTIANKKRVDGSIMLTFRDSKGQEVTATKRMYATTSARSKKGEPTTRSDEFTLSYKDALGETHSISSKVVDFNREMINRLGVPKAILDYVLFCHQEESNWPLSEPKALKLRFDAIFEVTKYTRALQNIKKMIKEYEDKIKLADSKLPYMLENRSERIRALKEAQNCKERIDVLATGMEEKRSRQQEIRAEMRSLQKHLHAKIDSEKGDYDDLKRNDEQIIERAQKKVNDLRTKKSNIQGTCTALERQIQQIDMEVRRKQKEMADINNSTQKLSSLENEIADCEERLAEIGDVAVLEDSIAGQKRQRSLLHDKLKQLRTEESELQKSAECASNLERCIREKAQLEEKLRELSNKHRADYTTLFGDVPNHSFRAKVTTVSTECDASMRSAELEMKKIEREFVQDSQRLQQLKGDLARKQRELSSHMEKITRVIAEPSQVQQRIEQTRKVVDKARSKLGQIDGCDFLYEQWENDVTECQACPLCERSYRTASEAQQLASKIRERRSDLPKEKGQLAAEVKKKEQDMFELNKVAPFVEIATAIETVDIPELEKKIAALDIKSKDSEKRRSSAESKLSELKNRERVIKRITADASLMDSHREAIENLEEDCALIREALGSQFEDQRSISHVKAEIANSQKEYDSYHTQIEKNQAVIERRNSIMTKINALRDQKNKLGEKVLTSGAIKNTIEARKKEAVGYSEEIDEHGEQLRSLEEQLYRAEEELNELESSYRERHSKQGAHYAELTWFLNDIMSMLDRTKKYGEPRGNMESYDWDGESLEDMKRKHKQLSDEAMRIDNESYMTDGELTEKRKKMEELKRRIREKFQNVEKEFRELLIEKCVWKRTVQDLKSYFRVVDESIISFHQSKMEQINYILEDLWRRVYKGTDIQTIKIKSNPVDSAEDKRKSYDYCVMMTVDSVEVEMRDRCSAGQKVLASILIRIALADVFAGRCSILALDEPTTNLDIDKVEAMGEMLISLIKNRVVHDSQQATYGFQLIVITHDMRLVENLYRDCKPECVYGLSKDAFGVSHMKRYTHFELTH
ncbi:hypothetical protein QR680_008318 [Steinernema hermaphroditum]|uniref:Rad50/SbcC-type AAA domain-containing protein n=1 Tax=Steinernema hermaphroditum TaxID=289476 RepID=A0AA39M6U4_9BILA|nr:hypothetical protein QR680_008318 [Steinernema hermaphroditum]